MGANAEISSAPDHESIQFPLVKRDSNGALLHMHLQRAYQAPPMIDGEVPSSWIYRISAKYGVQPRTICHLFGWTTNPALLDVTDSPPDMTTVAFVTVKDDSLIASGFAHSQQLLGYVPDLTTHADGSPIYRVCVRCLEEDPVPHIRRHWRLALTVYCERHGEAMLERCPACSNRINLTIRINPKGRKRHRVPQSTGDHTLCYCPTCFARLTDIKSAPIPPILLPSLGNFQQLVYNAILRGYYGYPTYGRIPWTKLLKPYLLKEWRDQETGGRHRRPRHRDRLKIDWKSIIGAPHYGLFRQWLSGRVECHNDTADLLYENAD